MIDPALGWHRLALAQLVAVTARPALTPTLRGFVPLSRIGMHAVVARVVHRLREETGLGRFGAVSGTPGFTRALGDVIAKLRLARLGPASDEAAVARFRHGLNADVENIDVTAAGLLPGKSGVGVESGHSNHAVMRRADLMADIGEESRFRFIRPNRLIPRALRFCAGLLGCDAPDRYRDPEERPPEAPRVPRKPEGRLVRHGSDLYFNLRPKRGGTGRPEQGHLFPPSNRMRAAAIKKRRSRPENPVNSIANQQRAAGAADDEVEKLSDLPCPGSRCS